MVRRQEGSRLTIRELREDRNWSQTGLAMRLGISPRTLDRYERGLTKPTYGRLVLIAQVFSIQVTDIDEVKRHANA